MAGIKESGDRAVASKLAYVQKRRPRTGPRRAVNLVMTDEFATRLEHMAVANHTTPAEIVMDLIEGATVGMRVDVPGVGSLGKKKAGKKPAGGEGAAA